MRFDSLLGRSKQRLSPESKAEMEGHEFSLYIRPKGKQDFKDWSGDGGGGSFQTLQRVLYLPSVFPRKLVVIWDKQPFVWTHWSILLFQIVICGHQAYANRSHLKCFLWSVWTAVLTEKKTSATQSDPFDKPWYEQLICNQLHCFL